MDRYKISCDLYPATANVIAIRVIRKALVISHDDPVGISIHAIGLPKCKGFTINNKISAIIAITRTIA